MNMTYVLLLPTHCGETGARNYCKSTDHIKEVLTSFQILIIAKCFLLQASRLSKGKAQLIEPK